MTNEERKLLESFDGRLKKLEQDVGSLNDFAFGDEDAVNERGAIDDIRLMRMVWRRFKSARFILGAIVAFLSFLASAGWAVHKIIEFAKSVMQAKAGG